MNHPAQPSHVRRTLFVGHVAVLPVSSECGEIEVPGSNVLAMTLAGVFAKHDGPRRHVIATPNHALFLPAGAPYRISFPGGIGDRCLVLRFSTQALAQALPEAVARDGLDTSLITRHALLEPKTMLARTLLWQRLERGEIDPLEVEERGIRQPWRGGGAQHRRRQVEAIKEVIAVEPGRKWTLGELARLACVSPGHLAHVFRAEEGSSLYQYVLRSRLAWALDAVLDSDTGLTEIALDAGFASHSHFTARFRALFGHTPVSLRRGGGEVRVHDLRQIVTARGATAA
jgi:AraC family transcriptional regulator